MLDLKEIGEFLDGQACVADQRPEGPLREFLVVGHGETPVGRFGVTKDHVASFLHVDFITEAAQGFRGLRSGDDGQLHQAATWMISSSMPGGMGSPCFWRLCK